MKSQVVQIIVLGVLLVISVAVLALVIAIFVKIESKTSGDTTLDSPKKPLLLTGQLSDWNVPWNSEMANPRSPLFIQTASQFEISIKQALILSNYELYATSQVTVSRLSGQYTNSTNTAVAVEFSIGIDGNPQPQDVEKDLKNGSANRWDWRNINIKDADISPLPEPDHSEGWTKAAQTLLNTINTSVDPCQDFYHFTCDNYMRTHPFAGLGIFHDLQKIVNENLSQALDQMPPDAKPRSVKLAGDVYKACKTVDYSIFSPKIVLDIANEYGGWPILDPHWNYEKIPHGIFWAIGDMTTKYGVETLSSQGVDVDMKNVSRHLLYVNQARLAYPAIYYTTPDLSQHYQELLGAEIYKTIKRLDATIDNDTLGLQIDRMVAIEYRLAQISIPATEARNYSLGYNPYTIPEAQARFPAFEWNSFFQGLLHSVFQDDPSSVVDPFILEKQKYWERLSEYLAILKSDPSSTRDLVNYVIYRLISQYMEFSGSDSRMTSSRGGLAFNSQDRIATFSGSLHQFRTLHQEYSRELECAAYLVTNFEYAAGRIYVDNHFPMENMEDIEVIINDVLSAFISSMSGLNWLDKSSALQAFHKVSNLLKNVAYPDFEQNDSQLDDYYKALIDNTKSIDPKDPMAYYYYVRELTSFLGQNALIKLKQPGDRTQEAWFGVPYGPATVDAWDHYLRNSISFTAAILNEPFYRNDFPKAVNYGALGSIIGHELFHGYDDIGVQFDWDGSLNTWMTQSTENSFREITKCVVDEYSRFCYPEVHLCVNGITTQADNIGDNGGVKAAYRAYKAYTASHGDEKPLPGLENYSMDQIFFMSYAYVFCGDYSPDALTKQLLTNPHTTGLERITVPLRNFPKFGEVFGCKKGDSMYPTSSTCDVW